MKNSTMSESCQIASYKSRMIIVGIFLILIPMEVAFAQLDPVSIVVGNFLQKRLTELIGGELLKSKSSEEGKMIVNKAYKVAKQYMDAHYRKKQEKIVTQYDRELKGKNVAHPDATTQKIIDRCYAEMNSLLGRWAADEKKLEAQRVETIQYFSKYWDSDNNRKTTNF